MNSLNSLIIEGAMKEIVPSEDGKYVDFKIVNTRTVKEADGSTVSRNEIFDCKAFGTVKNYIMQRINSVVDIRVVGALRCPEGKVYIAAEHVEFRSKKGANNAD